MKNKILLGLVIAMMLLMSTLMVSAVSVSYSDSYLPKDKVSINGHTSGDISSIQELINDKQNKPKKDTIKSKYPKVEITTDKFLGVFGGNPILDIELIDNTEFCTIDCYSIIEANVYQKTALLDKIETRSFIGNKLEYTNNIDTKTYILKNISYITEIPQYETRCTQVKLGDKTGSVCQDWKTGVTNNLEYKEEFVEYNNEELDPGKYVIKIVGKKNSFNQIIDWVPTIQSQKIEALAWWNITDVYGNGSLGDVYFSSSTKNYGNMTLNVDYTVAGNTLYLKTDRIYQFNSFYLGPGTTLSTQNTTGAVIYIMSKNDLNIQGNIDLRAKIQPGQYNTTSFSYLGDSFNTPSVASGASAYIGGGQAGGFGGGATGGVTIEEGCSTPTAGTGATGGFPFGPGGGGASVQSTNDNCVVGNGGNGAKSGGGGGTASAYDSGSNCDIRATGGAGGGSYGANGGAGTSTGTHGSTWSCTSGSIGSGGGGAGGSAGQPGVNLVLRGLNLTINNNINIAGTNGTKGGNGGTYRGGSWTGGSGPWGNFITGDSGYGGGGGGGASAGNIKLYYRYLTNTSSLNSLIIQTAGLGGAGGTWASGINPAGSGGNGNAGTMSLNQEGFVTTTLLNPANNSQVVTPAIVSFTATVTPTAATLVNATFYLWKAGVLNNTQFTVLSGTNPVNVSWNRTAADMPDGNWAWAVNTCWTDGTVAKCSQTQNNSFTTFSVQFQPSTYNNRTYEMLNETYSVNVTSTGFVNLSGTLVWEGVEYPAVTTGNNVNATFTRSIWIPVGAGNKSFHWHVFYGGQLKESTPENVTVLNSQFIICNFTNGSLTNIPFLNIIYKDETTNLQVNATVVNSVWNYNVTGSPYGEQYIFSSPSINGTQQTQLQHQFCFNPPYASIIVPTASYQYGNPPAGYATKIWPLKSLPLSNSTTTYTMWMINLIDSGTTPVTFQAVSSQTSTVMPNVRVSVYRDIAGTPTLVDDGYTDTAGTIAYYLSPITSYTIIASGGDFNCAQLTSTITPSSSQYNLILDCSGTQSGEPYTSNVDGVTYQRSPQDGVNRPGLIHYSYAVNSLVFNMTRVAFQLVDGTDGTILAYNTSLTNVPGCTPSSCMLTLDYTTFNGDNIKGRYFIATNGTTDADLILLERDAYWRFIGINNNNSVNAIGRLMINVQELFNTWGVNNVNCIIYNDSSTCASVPECKWVTYQEWSPKESENYNVTKNLCVARDDLNKAEFNRIVVIFFFFAVFLFILGRTTGYELNHPGAFVIGMSLVIWILSAYGMFTFQGLTQYEYFNRYIFALTTSCIAGGYAISIIRRYSG